MNLTKTIKFLSLTALICGFSGCTLPDGDRYDNGAQEPIAYDNANNAKKETTGAKEVSSSRQPVQKATPGPKRAAAPQLPVIQ